MKKLTITLLALLALTLTGCVSKDIREDAGFDRYDCITTAKYNGHSYIIYKGYSKERRRTMSKSLPIVTEQEREVCRLAPNSLTAAMVRFRLAMLRVRIELSKGLKRLIR